MFERAAVVEWDELNVSHESVDDRRGERPGQACALSTLAPHRGAPL
jgi:hypothetical protein